MFVSVYEHNTLQSAAEFALFLLSINNLNPIILPLGISDSTSLKQFYTSQCWKAMFTDHDKNIVES